MQGTNDLPRVVVTSYDMLHRLTCEPCKRSDMNACTGRQVAMLSCFGFRPAWSLCLSLLDWLGFASQRHCPAVWPQSECRHLLCHPLSCTS
jgi:hypothetical protein